MNIFPSQEVIGLDIGRRFIKAIVLRKTKGGIEITKAALTAIDSLPEEKEEIKREKILGGLKVTMAELGRKSGRVALACPGESLFPRLVKLPPVSKGKLKQVVQYEAQQQIPFSLEEVIWDYHLLGQKEKSEMTALILAVKKEIVEETIRLVEAAKLDIEVLDFTPLAIYNILKFNGVIDGDKAKVIIDMGAESTDITIFENGAITMIRPIPIGGDNLTQALARTLNIDFLEAEKIKAREAVVPIAERAVENEQERKIFEAMRPLLEELLDEIRRSIGYYRSQLRGGAIESLILTGGGLQLKNIDKFMEANLRLKIEKPDPFTRIHLPVELLSKFPEPSTFNVAMGLGLRLFGEGEVKINLLPAPIIQRVEFRKKRPLFILSFVLVLLSVLVYAGIITQRASNERALLKGITAILSDYQELENSLKPEREEKEKILKFISQIEEIKEKRAFWLEALNEVTNLLPEGITLEGFYTLGKEEKAALVQAPGNSAELAGRLGERAKEIRSSQKIAAVAKGFKLEGFSQDFPSISDFITRLEASPLFGRVEVDPSSGQTVKGEAGEFIKFILMVEVK